MLILVLLRERAVCLQLLHCMHSKMARETITVQKMGICPVCGIQCTKDARIQLNSSPFPSAFGRPPRTKHSLKGALSVTEDVGQRRLDRNGASVCA